MKIKHKKKYCIGGKWYEERKRNLIRSNERNKLLKQRINKLEKEMLQIHKERIKLI